LNQSLIRSAKTAERCGPRKPPRRKINKFDPKKIGMTEAAKGHYGSASLSIGRNRHEIALKRAEANAPASSLDKTIPGFDIGPVADLDYVKPNSRKPKY
jgi:hypothetical protein